MSDFPEFTIRVDQNPYLPAGGREMHAIVSVEARSSGAAPGRGRAGAGRGDHHDRHVRVDVVPGQDGRGEAGGAGGGERAARRRALRGGRRREPAADDLPAGERLVVADETSRRNAATAIGRLEAAGGTAIGSWLRLAERLFAGHDAAVGESAVKHAILLTDGKNQHESDEELDAALRQCTGRFLCDARGVGTDWDVAELRKISSALLGGFLDVPDPADLEADFLAMTRAAMSKEIADVTLRVWTPQQAKLRFVKQMVPVVEDLTGRRVESGTQTGDYPLGAWGNENREYHVCVEVQPGDIGRQMRAAWVKLVAGDEVLASGNVLAEWTDDEARSTRINGRVAIHTGQSELADAIQEGLEARREGDEDTATARLGRAVVLAREVGNEQISDLLDKVVDVVDPVRGTVRLKRDVAKADEMSLDTRSVRTVRTRHGDEAGG
ncbi:hypothetical protein [Actinomadura madurae]|nr:hypothetical protein [Actinomadura madurae]